MDTEQKKHEESGSPSDSEHVMSKPILGPTQAGPEYIFETDARTPLSPALRLGRYLADLIRGPAHWYRENIVEPYRGPKYYWYHRKYKRALPIDECYIDDFPCVYEANQDFKRTHMVDKATIDLLKQRLDNCYYWHSTNKAKYSLVEECKDIADTYDREELNFFIKYGDIHFRGTVLQAYTKQKHRMIMERRRALKEAQGERREERPPK